MIGGSKWFRGALSTEQRNRRPGHAVRELTTVVVASLRARPTVLILDALEAATPAMAPVLEACLEAAVVLGATRDCRPGLQKLWWAFERLVLPPLARDDAKALLWTVVDRARPRDRRPRSFSG